MHWIFLFRAGFNLIFAFGRASAYFRRQARSDLSLPANGVWPERQNRRWKHYFFGTTFLAAVFCLLRGYSRNGAEKRRYSQLAALACFFDDLADTFRHHDGSAVPPGNPEQYGQAADPGGTAVHLLHTLYRDLPPENLPEFKTYLHRVFQLETDGKQQNGQALPLEELQRLTAEKGGCSVLLFRRLLDNSFSETEKEALFQFGALIQLCDDIFDLWFDRQNGVATLATLLSEQNNLPLLQQYFNRQTAATIHAFRQTPYPRLHVETALRAVHFLVSITRVCLDHYRDLQKKRGTLPLGKRRDMVVDMEQSGNRLRATLKLFNKLL